MQLWGSLVHLEYSASYLISCGDSGKPTETNLDVHNYLVRLVLNIDRPVKSMVFDMGWKGERRADLEQAKTHKHQHQI